MMKRRALLGLMCVAAMLMSAGAAQAEERERLYRAPDLYEAHEELVRAFISAHASTRGVGMRRETVEIPHDGTELYLAHRAMRPADYEACLRWSLRDASGQQLHEGHACGDWLDAADHETTLATAEQSAAATELVVDLFTFKEAPEVWDGSGERPEGALTHDRLTYEMIDAARAEQAAFTRAVVEEAVKEKAPQILRCAHPTAGYEWASVHQFDHKEDGVEVGFVVYYKCRLTNRMCSMALTADYANDGTMRDMTVERDTAHTNPELGLKACEAVLDLLKR